MHARTPALAAWTRVDASARLLATPQPLGEGRVRKREVDPSRQPERAHNYTVERPREHRHEKAGDQGRCHVDISVLPRPPTKFGAGRSQLIVHAPIIGASRLALESRRPTSPRRSGLVSSSRVDTSRCPTPSFTTPSFTQAAPFQNRCAEGRAAAAGRDLAAGRSANARYCLRVSLSWRTARVRGARNGTLPPFPSSRRCGAFAARSKRAAPSPQMDLRRSAPASMTSHGVRHRSWELKSQTVSDTGDVSSGLNATRPEGRGVVRRSGAHSAA